MIFRNRILRGLDSTSFAAMLPHLRSSMLVREQVLVEQDEAPDQVWFPETAILSAVRLMRDGRMVELATFGNDGAAGLLACLSGAGSHSRIVTQGPGAALGIRAPTLRALASANPDLHRSLLDAVRELTDRVEQNLACNALHDVPSRLARWLLETRDRAESDRLHLTQEELATTLGVQRTTVNAAALQLKSSGAITYTRGLVRIVAPARLEAATCECYGAPQPAGARRTGPGADLRQSA